MQEIISSANQVQKKRQESKLIIKQSWLIVLVLTVAFSLAAISARSHKSHNYGSDDGDELFSSYNFEGRQLRSSDFVYRPAVAPDRAEDNEISLADDDDDDDDNLISHSRLIGLTGAAPGQAVAAPADRQRSDIDELVLHRLLAARQAAQAASAEPVEGEIYLLEDKDYPKSFFEDKRARRVGQVSGLTTLPNNQVVIFHRADRHWSESTFNETTKQIARDKQDDLIKEDTIMIFDQDGSSLKSFGSNLFYMPHSIASDNLGNLWVSDVARHQVMRLPALNIKLMPQEETAAQNGSGPVNRSGGGTQIWPDIILGEAFVPGTDAGHFCQPSEIAVSSNGRLVYVADGYCNQRVMVFAGTTGKFIASFGQREDIRVVHSLALVEEKNLLCAADRENHRILCYNAGLDGDLTRLGELTLEVNYPIGRVFAIARISPDHLLVSSNQPGTSIYNLAVLEPFTRELKLVWTSSDLLEPHSLATTVDRRYAYAADVSKDSYKKIFKFHVIRR